MHDNYEFDMGDFLALNQLFFLFSRSRHSDHAGQRINEQDNNDWNRDNAVIFLGFITRIYLYNMDSLYNSNQGTDSFIQEMAAYSDSLSSAPYRRSGASRGEITIENYLDPSSDIARNKYQRTDNGMWLQALAFFLPFRSHRMAMATRDDPLHSQIHRHFDYIVSIFSNKRFQRSHYQNSQSIDPAHVIMGKFNSLLESQNYELEFLYLSFMRSLSLAMTQILLAPTEESRSQAITVQAVLSNHISSDLHIATIRAILNTLPQYSHQSLTPNREFFMQILLQEYNANRAEVEVNRLLNSRTSENMRAVINRVLRRDLVAAPAPGSRQFPSLTEQQQHSVRAGQAGDAPGGSLCSNENCPNHQRLLSVEQRYVEEEAQWEEERKALESQLLTKKTENEHFHSELDQVKTECELKLREMREKLDHTNQNAQSATEKLQKLQAENTHCQQIIAKLTDQNKATIRSATGTESDFQGIIDDIYQQADTDHETSERNRQIDQQTIQSLQEELNDSSQRVEASNEQHRSNQTTIQELRVQVANLQELNDGLIQQAERQGARPQEGLMARGLVAPQQNQARHQLQARPAGSHQSEARAAPQRSENNCCICLEANEDPVAMTPCGHSQFCSNCATSVRETGKCPICRSDINDSIRVHLK